MHIKDYFSEIEKIIEASRIIHSKNITFDDRSDYIGLIKGTLYFINGALLHFKEFVDVEERVECYKYAYHYQKGDKVIFRYDNAKDSRAFRLSSFPAHKHMIDDQVVETKKVNLSQALEEITNLILKEKK